MLKYKSHVIISTFLALIILFTGCENKEDKSAFLGIDAKNSSSSEDVDLNIMSTIKTDLLRNSKSLLESEPVDIGLFCSNYRFLDNNGRLDFWSKLIYIVINSINNLDLERLGCEGLSVESAFCIQEVLKDSFVERRRSAEVVLSEELAVQTSALSLCRD